MIVLRLILSPFLSQLNEKNILSKFFKNCSGGAGNTVNTCINIGNVNVFITQTLPSSESDLNDQSLKSY